MSMAYSRSHCKEVINGAAWSQPSVSTLIERVQILMKLLLFPKKISLKSGPSNAFWPGMIFLRKPLFTNEKLRKIVFLIQN